MSRKKEVPGDPENLRRMNEEIYQQRKAERRNLPVGIIGPKDPRPRGRPIYRGRFFNVIEQESWIDVPDHVAIEMRAKCDQCGRRWSDVISHPDDGPDPRGFVSLSGRIGDLQFNALICPECLEEIAGDLWDIVSPYEVEEDDESEEGSWRRFWHRWRNRSDRWFY